MTRYELAGNKWITIAAIIFEVLMIVACVLLANAAAEQFLALQTPIANHLSVVTWGTIVAVLQYLILGLEMVARYRDDQRGFTLPLAFLPGGMIVRSALMAALVTVVLVFKLLVYFVSVLLAFIFQIVRLDRVLGTSWLVDLTDRLLEPLEIGVNRLYNLLYFHKIRANTSVFTSVFNGGLSLWCINH